jgi:single-strand DNA-binding protein
MNGYNHITLVGNLTADPESKAFEASRSDGDGNRQSTRTFFALAVNGPRKKDKGPAPVDFINVVTWGKLAELCSEYLKKGKRILVDGQLHIREYQNKEKKTNWFTEVHADNVTFLDFAPDSSPKVQRQTVASQN